MAVVTLNSSLGFLLLSVATGLGFGAAYHGAVRTLFAVAEPHHRTGLLATVYLISYVGAGVPSFAAGFVTAPWGLRTVVAVYLAVVVGLTVAAGLMTISPITSFQCHGQDAARRLAPS